MALDKWQRVEHEVYRKREGERIQFGKGVLAVIGRHVRLSQRNGEVSYRSVPRWSEVHREKEPRKNLEAFVACY
jgi:hypothetical protein